MRCELFQNRDQVQIGIKCKVAIEPTTIFRKSNPYLKTFFRFQQTFLLISKVRKIYSLCNSKSRIYEKLKHLLKFFKPRKFPTHPRIILSPHQNPPIHSKSHTPQNTSLKKITSTNHLISTSIVLEAATVIKFNFGSRRTLHRFPEAWRLPVAHFRNYRICIFFSSFFSTLFVWKKPLESSELFKIRYNKCGSEK